MAEEKKKFDLKEATSGFEWMITEEGERLDVITIRDRKIPLRLTLRDVKPLSEEVGNVVNLQDILQTDFLGGEHTEKVIKMIRIMGNSGLWAMGDPADLTDDWIGDHLKVRDINETLILHLMLTAYGGMQMETEEAEEEGKEVDVVLRDLRKKKEADN